MRRRVLGGKKKRLFTKRFFPAGNYTWIVPSGCTEVDVFLVGAGAGGALGGGGGGYTKTYKRDMTGWRDGNAVSVTTGEIIQITVGKGGYRGGTSAFIAAKDGGYSQFLSSSYRADGGKASAGLYYASGGSGGSGGSGYVVNGAKPGGKDGADGQNGQGSYYKGMGQGHTTREWGEANGTIYSSGGYGGHNLDYNSSTVNIGKNGNNPGDAGSAGADGSRIETGSAGIYGGNGADGIVIIRYLAYTE